MKRLNIILIATIAIMSLSCSQEKLTVKALDNLEGTWKFEKVELLVPGWFKSKDLTHEFADIEWVFKDGGDVLKIQRSTNDTTYGTFKLEDVDRDVYDIHLRMIREESDPHEIENILWTYVCIHKKRIHAEEEISDSEVYGYKLRKKK